VIDTQNEQIVQMHAVGWLMMIPFAITDCPCGDCNGKLVPTDAFGIMFQHVDDVAIETHFEEE
jgi:hypothetical protein